MIVYFLGINLKHFHHGYFKNLWDPLGLRSFVFLFLFFSATLAATLGGSQQNPDLKGTAIKATKQAWVYRND